MIRLQELTTAIGASLRSKKKFNFDVTFNLLELVNCTFVTGVLFAKVQLKDGGTFSDTSDRCEVDKHHRVLWDQEFRFPVKMYASASTGELDPCYCKISVKKETKGGKSSTKLGFVRINLAEFAGGGIKEAKLLLDSYNESKRKPDNSVVKVRLYLRQLTGGPVFNVPKQTKKWEIEDDEGFEDHLSLRTTRTSNASTLSSFSIGTGTLSWASSAGNLRSQDGSSEVSPVSQVAEESQQQTGSDDGESEETVVENTPSTATISKGSLLSTSGQKNVPDPDSSDTVVSGSVADSQPRSSSFRDLRHSPTLRTKASSLAPPSLLQPQSMGGSGSGLLSPSASKTGPIVSSSRVTAFPGSIGSHRRQVSLGTVFHNSSPSSHHKRNSSYSIGLPTSSEMSEAPSTYSSRTRMTCMSTLQQTRVNVHDVVRQLVSSHDLTPASEDDGDSNLKLYLDKQGKVTLAGHELDSTRYKQIEVTTDDIQPRPHPRRKRHKKDSSSEPSQETQRNSSPPLKEDVPSVQESTPEAGKS